MIKKLQNSEIMEKFLFLKKKYDNLSVQLRASFWFLVCSVLQKGISVISTPIFTRLFTTSEYGQFQVFNSWLSIVTVFVTLQLTAGVYTMGIVKFKEEEKIFTSSLQGLALTMCLIWTVVYFISRDFWNSLFNLTTVQMLSMMVMIWATEAFTFWMTTQRNSFRYKELVIVTLIVSILKPTVGVFFVINANDKVTARILGLALVELICYSSFFIIQMKQGKVFYSSKYWKYAILFNLPLIPHYLSGTVLSSSDRIMIQRLNGDSYAGIYSLAYSIARLMNMISDALNKTMSPWLYQKIRSRQFDKMPKAVYGSLIIIAICNIILIAVAPEIVTVFAPEEYHDAIYAIVPVALSSFFTYMYLCFAPFEFYYEKRIWTTIGTMVSAVLNIALNYIFIPIFGYIAAGYTTLLCYILYAIFHFLIMRRVCKSYIDNLKPYNTGLLIGMSLAFLGIGLLFIPIYKLPIIRYSIITIVFISVALKWKGIKTVVNEIMIMK